MPSHQRNVSQGQHLIVDRSDSADEEERGQCDDVATSTCVVDMDDAPYSNGVYPGGSPVFTPSRPQENKAKGICGDPQFRSNIKVILGSIVLTVIGVVLLVYGCIVVIRPEEGMQHWVFFFAGLVCFVPGAYHLYYVICVICQRPGYSFDKLPTFNR